MSEEVPAAPQPTALEREIAQSERWGDWDRVEDLKKKLERTLTKRRKDEKRNQMSEEQNRLDELLQEKDDLDSAITEARLLVTDDEETPAPEVEPVVTETPTPANQTAILAAINKLEAEGKFAEASPLKAKLLEIRSGYSSGLSATPTAAPEVVSVAELRKQIDAFEAKGDWKSSGALKAQIVQRTPVDGISQ